MENRQENHEEENLHLRQTIDEVERQLTGIRKNLRGKEEMLAALRQEMLEDATQEVADLYSMQGFHDLVELSQNAQSFAGDIAEYATETNRAEVLTRMLNAPYFARVDVRFEGEGEAEPIYVGRASLLGSDYSTMFVYDWRSPVAGLFYRFGVGPVSYQAPAGRITGEMTLKRQYEIHKGELAYYFDADVQVADAYLRSMLAHNASAQMKTIVETIQRDQDTAIRDVHNDLLMVQGAAGSGKTAIGLHRAAYQMYQGLATRLGAEDILILSPSTLFAHYIAQVLPELGEKTVRTHTLEDVYGQLFPSLRIQTKNEYFEALFSCEDPAAAQRIRRNAAFKTSPQFQTILDRYLEDLPRSRITFKDIDYAGQCIADGAASKTRVLTEGEDMPLCTRLRRLEHAILETVHTMRPSRLIELEDAIRRSAVDPADVEEAAALARMASIDECTTLVWEIRRFTELDFPALYRSLFQNASYFIGLARGIDLPEDIEEIIQTTYKNLCEGCLRHEDAAAVAYLCVKAGGFSAFHGMRHVVMDEAQDHGPLHFALCGLLFPSARFTVLGDIHQAIGKTIGQTFYDQVAATLHKESTAMITLGKSFRCTREILDFGAKLLGGDVRIESFNRPGDAPRIHAAANIAEEVRAVLQEVSACRAAGCQSIALLCKTARDARAWHDRLQEQTVFRLVEDEDAVDVAGTLILPIYLAKGLEFDAVLLCDADRAHYHAQEDRQLLYVACSRALHRLGIFYTEEMSPLVQQALG